MSIINRGILDSRTAYLRQVGNDWPTAQVVYTADVLESSSNLYFTTARVASNVTTLLKSFQGSGLTIDAANGQININTVAASVPQLANVANTVISLAGHTTSEIIEGSNLYYTDSRVNVAIRPILTTANVIETSSNLYFTTARVNATVQPFLTTANVIETSSNLYFTTARVNTTIQPFLTTANVIETAGNLYFTNTRAINALTIGTVAGSISVTGNLVANGLIIRGINVSDVVLTGNVVAEGGLAGNNIIVDSITANTWNRLYTANVIETSGNLYFTNARVRSAISAGKGINIDLNGVIKNTGGDIFYNLNLDGAVGGNVLGTMASFLTFPTTFTNDRFMVRSIHIANMSNDISYVSANIVYAGTGQTIPLGVQVPVPLGGVTEFLPRYQIFQPGDSIQLQGFNTAGAATANILSATIAYDTQSGDITYIGNGVSLSTVSTNQIIYNSSSAYSIIENLKFVNTISTPVKVSTYWGDANGVPISYLVYGMSIPANSAVEVLQAAKRINLNDKLYASYTGATNDAVSAFVSARLGSVYAIGSYSSTTVPAGNAILSFASTDPDGSIIYYTLE